MESVSCWQLGASEVEGSRGRRRGASEKLSSEEADEGGVQVPELTAALASAGCRGSRAQA